MTDNYATHLQSNQVDEFIRLALLCPRKNKAIVSAIVKQVAALADTYGLTHVAFVHMPDRCYYSILLVSDIMNQSGLRPITCVFGPPTKAPQIDWDRSDTDASPRAAILGLGAGASLVKAAAALRAAGVEVPAALVLLLRGSPSDAQETDPEDLHVERIDVAELGLDLALNLRGSREGRRSADPRAESRREPQVKQRERVPPASYTEATLPSFSSDAQRILAEAKEMAKLSRLKRGPAPSLEAWPVQGTPDDRRVNVVIKKMPRVDIALGRSKNSSDR
jgi:hypothetical protein